MPGRPPKPTKVLEMQGTLRRDRHSDRSDLQVDSAIPEAPEWLSEEARSEWDRLTNGQYAKALANVDRAMLAIFCQRWAHYVASEQSGQPIKAAEIAVLISLGAKLGLNPSDRTKLRMPEAERPKSKWAALKASTSSGA
jgi:phage terminase small subunit